MTAAMSAQQKEEELLDYAARLSGLLLNDATDVMRWFLLDHLPRRNDQRPDLLQVLSANRKLFEDLRDNKNTVVGDVHFGHEMFDILYPPQGGEVDESNLEISLIFILIRFVCKIKHPAWKWWNEDPQTHQATPIFDVIRLHRFKNNMKNIVHKYEITKESYEASLNYITNVIDHLRGYKFSTRRWKDNVISYHESESITKGRKSVDYVTVMRWQTLPMEQREATYLVMKKNFEKKAKKNGDRRIAWKGFISCFGQITYLNICETNEVRRTEAKPELQNSLASGISPATLLNWELVYDHIWKQSIRENPEAQPPKNCKSNKMIESEEDRDAFLTSLERGIYESVDDKVFIKDLESNSRVTDLIREKWKANAIKECSHIRMFPYSKFDRIPISDVTIRLGRKREDSKLEKVTSWMDVFDKPSSEGSSSPLRLVITDDRSSGKTTLLQKILYDCATRNCRKLEDYDILFYIDLSDVQIEKPYTRIAECILEQCLGHQENELTAEKVEEVIKRRNGKGILFLFDNLEHMVDCDEMSEFTDVINSYLWPESGIVICSGDSVKKLLDQSQFPWKQYHTLGFAFHDVIKEVRRVFGRSVDEITSDDVTISRHVTNLIRVFQRDVYMGEESSPVLVSVLCHAWKIMHGNLNNPRSLTSVKCKNLLTECMSEIMKVIFPRYSAGAESEEDFARQVFEGTICEGRLKYFHVTPDSVIERLLNCGILLQKTAKRQSNVEKIVYFSHPAFQSYYAACYYCQQKCRISIRDHVRSISDALRLRHFLILASGQRSDAAEDILEILSDLVNIHEDGAKSSIPKLKPNSDQLLEKKFLDLCIQCFNESDLGRGSRGHCQLTTTLRNMEPSDKRADQTQQNVVYSDGQMDLVAANLSLFDISKFSSRTRQSLLKFVRACRPPLTESGTIFPLMTSLNDDPVTSYIRLLSVSDIGKDQVTFVASIISNLPFLDEMVLTCKSDVTDEAFKTLCVSMNFTLRRMVSSVHKLSISFKSTTQFDVLQVTSYEPLGDIMDRMPYLETLKLSPLTYQHFISLFGNSERGKYIVPIQDVILPRSNITEARCSKLAPLLARSIFMRNLNLFQNPVHGGLIGYKVVFSHFRCLGEINLEECCLSPESVSTLSECLTLPNIVATLTSLNLGANHVDDESALLCLVHALHHVTSLRVLDLSSNFLRNRVICVLASGLRNLMHLRELRMDYVQMGDIGFSSLRSNFFALEGLEVLSLGENPLSSTALELIPDFCAENVPSRNSLRELKISGISQQMPLNASRNAIKAFSNSLQNFTKLETLDMRHIKMKHSEVISLLSSAENHSSVKEVRLTGPLIPMNEKKIMPWTCLTIV